MGRRIEIDEEWAGARVDRLLRALLPGLSFAGAQALLRRGALTVNGGRPRGADRLAAGDVVEVENAVFAEIEAGPAGAGHRTADRIRGARAGAETAGAQPEGANAARAGRAGASDAETLAVLREDDEVIVIDKPAGIPVQPGNEPERGSILDLLAARQAADPAPAGGAVPFPWTPVHRLDRETTGVLVVAKTRAAARALSAAFREGGTVRKIYLAVVEGAPDPPGGLIDLPIAVEKRRASLARVDDGGRPARTRYRLLRSLAGGRALVEATIETGRTHQVRVHLAAIGCPVAGDARYGRGGGPLLLHAWRIAFPHPVTGRTVTVTAAPPAGMPDPGERTGEKP